MKLSEEEIIQILKLIEGSRFDELHLEMDDLKLIVRKGGYKSPSRKESVIAAPPNSTVSQEPVIDAKEQEAENKTDKTEPKAEAVPKEGLVGIKAPMLGTFYRRPDPTSPPYVEVGTSVSEDDTVCLIEVMKVFNSVNAGIQGTIVEICAESGNLVEYGQTLFLVKPAESSGKKKKKKS